MTTIEDQDVVVPFPGLKPEEIGLTMEVAGAGDLLGEMLSTDWRPASRKENPDPTPKQPDPPPDPKPQEPPPPPTDDLEALVAAATLHAEVAELRDRVARLEAQLQALATADAIIARASGRRHLTVVHP